MFLSKNLAGFGTSFMQVFSKDSNLPDAALGDSDCVELCAAVEQVAGAWGVGSG